MGGRLAGREKGRAMRFGDRARWFGLGAVVVGVLVGGIAYAAIPGTDGMIHGCYDKTGALRVSDKGCARGEKAISWDQHGTGGAGTSGPTGARGASGGSGPS